ncbi:MAG TPA: hypothetical protein VIT21_09375 [Chthoniobacterales bacterium]
MAVADTADWDLDFGVFIQEGSFSDVENTETRSPGRETNPLYEWSSNASIREVKEHVPMGAANGRIVRNEIEKLF